MEKYTDIVCNSRYTRLHQTLKLKKQSRIVQRRYSSREMCLPKYDDRNIISSTKI